MADTSVLLFKNGYSFVSLPVPLGGEGKEGVVEECLLGPLPPFAVHGTVMVQPLEGSREKEDGEW